MTSVHLIPIQYAKSSTRLAQRDDWRLFGTGILPRAIKWKLASIRAILWEFWSSIVFRVLPIPSPNFCTTNEALIPESRKLGIFKIYTNMLINDRCMGFRWNSMKLRSFRKRYWECPRVMEVEVFDAVGARISLSTLLWSNVAMDFPI